MFTLTASDTAQVIKDIKNHLDSLDAIRKGLDELEEHDEPKRDTSVPVTDEAPALKRLSPFQTVHKFLSLQASYVGHFAAASVLLQAIAPVGTEGTDSEDSGVDPKGPVRKVDVL